MNEAEKIEYAKSFLQTRIDEEFHYPFQVSFENGRFLFRFRNGKRECCARVRKTEQMLDCICGEAETAKRREVERIFEILRAAVQAQASTVLSDCSEYGKVKDELILRPLNYRYSKDRLKDVPHLRVGDIALVLYAVIKRDGANYFTAKMHRSQMENWTVQEREVLQRALVNTSFLYPPRLYSIEDLLSWDGKRHEDGRFMSEDASCRIRRGLRGYILTNTLEINGAIALFYPGVAKKIAEGLGERFYIAFTSIHEAQIHSAGMISSDVVERSLRDTNRHCNAPDEVLTNRVYCYDPEKKSFGIIKNGEFLEVKKDE
ncbi:MAG: DUF5688 family protein [Eubacteriales bacterium]|nr:DUF5688 family protein [Eubacteriales bacterium]